MEITKILKGPLNGNFSNSRLKMKESIIINCILACIFALAIIISAKTLASDLTQGMRFIPIDSIINRMLIRGFILITVNFIGIVLVFSGIIYIISKVIFNLEISYEECVSTCTYANIIPTYIMIIGVLFSLFSMNLSIIAIIMQIFVLIILTYEGLSNLIIIGKSKFIYSIAIAYIVNTGLFAVTNYLIIQSMIESSFRNFF